MPHERHRVGVEIQIAFVANQSRVIRGRKDNSSSILEKDSFKMSIITNNKISNNISMEEAAQTNVIEKYY